MWAHYGDGHKGACLIFEIDDNAGEPGLLLRKTGTDGGGGADEPTFKRMRLYRVRYGDRPSEVEFFAGQSLDPSRRDVTFKTTDWEYEQEYRLVLDRNGNEPLGMQARTLTYDFTALKGIAFGARMAEEDKARIRKIIDDKRIEHNRQWFDYRDGYYSPTRGNVQITSTSTALLSP